MKLPLIASLAVVVIACLIACMPVISQSTTSSSSSSSSSSGVSSTTIATLTGTTASSTGGTGGTGSTATQSTQSTGSSSTQTESSSTGSSTGGVETCVISIDGNSCETTPLTYSSPPLTTSYGALIGDDEDSLKANPHGPTLLEDNILRDKITHFDHERIPERVVHARGSAAHGYFESYGSISNITIADVFETTNRTPVFVRFSTVAGGAGSIDLPRDVRGFATRFYTNEGNWDLVGNSIPVFFIQDAMKFPDLVHAVKMEPDRGFPQAATAHHNFWDFISLMPESIHMIMWAMSDRGIPRSFRNIEGFGVNTFTFYNASQHFVFVKFHWKPSQGVQSVLWDEAVKINGADPDFHRRDLWQAIEDGNTTGIFPEFELGVQIITQEQAALLEFDVLDATKLVPEEIVPVTPIGKMVLNRNPDNFFDETEEVAFHPGNLPPGIGASNDPLLQGRLFSYIDTQITRLGGPNFNDIPINRPQCPFRNFQRDGFSKHKNDPGRINYSPNSAGVPSVTDNRNKLFGVLRYEAGYTVRARATSFADHYTQARLFYQSQTTIEQGHIVSALIIELSQVEVVAIRERMIGHLLVVNQDLASRVAVGLGIDVNSVTPATPLSQPHEVTANETSPSLSILKQATNDSISGRSIGVIVDSNTDTSLLNSLRAAVLAAGAQFTVLSRTFFITTGSNNGTNSTNSTTGGNSTSGSISVDALYSAKPSVLFDSVAVLLTSNDTNSLIRDSALVEWVSTAFNHLKIIGYVNGTEALLTRAGITELDEGVVNLANGADYFIQSAQQTKIWDRESSVRILP